MDSGDATITHATSELTILHATGDIVLSAAATDQDITFTVDDGGTDWSVLIDGSAPAVNFAVDSIVLALGADQDVTVTHVADTGINITTTSTSAGVINLGNDDDSNDDSIDLILHDSGIITLYDANDDTSASLSVADGESVFTMSGGLTVGGTDITDSTITDDGTLILDTATATTITDTGAAGSAATLNVGESDSIYADIYLMADDNTSAPTIT